MPAGSVCLIYILSMHECSEVWKVMASVSHLSNGKGWQMRFILQGDAFIVVRCCAYSARAWSLSPRQELSNIIIASAVKNKKPECLY